MKANNISKLISLTVGVSAVILFAGHNLRAELQPEPGKDQPPQLIIPEEHSDLSYYSTFSQNGALLAIAYQKKEYDKSTKVVIWNMVSQKIISKISIPYYADSIDFNPEKDMLLVSGITAPCVEVCDGYVNLYKLSSGKLIRSKKEEPGAEDEGPLARFADFGKVIISGAGSKTVWNTKTGRKLRSFNCPVDGCYSCPFDISPSQKDILIGYMNGTVKIWAINTGKLKTAIKAYINAGTWAVSYSADGEMFATWNWDEEEKALLKVWNISDGKEILSYRCGDCSHPLFSPDGSTIVVDAADLFDIQTGNLSIEIITKQNPVKFSPDGKFLITAEGFWEVSTGKLKYTFNILSSGDWVFFSDTGYFDASPGAKGKTKFRIEGREFSSSEYWFQYQRPGMFVRVMSGQEN